MKTYKIIVAKSVNGEFVPTYEFKHLNLSMAFDQLHDIIRTLNFDEQVWLYCEDTGTVKSVYERNDL